MSASQKPAQKRGHWLPVVAGIIRREKKVLLGLRPTSGSLAGLWEFPGGKIESGEQPQHALARELQEELGIQAEIGPLRFSATHRYGEVNVLLMFFEVNYWQGQPKAKHHQDIKWVDADELRVEKLPDANRIILDNIISMLK